MKRIKYAIFMIVSAFMLLITACGVSKGKGILQEDTVSWKENHSRLESQYVLALATERNIYGCYIKNDEVLLDSVDKESFLVNETFVLSDALLISGMAADQEGNVYILDDREESAVIWKVDADGRFQDHVSMNLEKEGYFSRQVDLDSTVKKIQNRVSLLLQEGF